MRSRPQPPNSRRRAFTLLELVVALVVLGILAALAVPTYASVISTTQSAVATSDALSVASDAVAIATTSDVFATEASFTAATAESSVVSLASPDNFIDDTTTSSITLSVTLASGAYDVTVSWPDSVNGAPYVTSATPATTTTTTPGSIGPPTDVVATFSSVDIYGDVLYDVSWTPGSGSDGGATYNVSTDMGMGFRGTCTTSVSASSCVLSGPTDPSMPVTFTPQVIETDGASSATGYAAPVTYTPPVPTDIAVVNNGDGSFTVNWTAAYPGDTFNATVLPDAGGDIYLTCASDTATTCNITTTQASGIGSFVVSVGEVNPTYGSGVAYSADTPNP